MLNSPTEDGIYNKYSHNTLQLQLKNHNITNKYTDEFALCKRMCSA